MSTLKIRLQVHYLPLTVISIISTYIFYELWDNMGPIPFITYASGYIGIFLLALSLLIGPVNLILNRKNPLSTYLRRDLGVFGGVLSLVHSVIGLFMHFTGKPWLYFVEEVSAGYAIRFGVFGIANYTGLLGALIILFLIAISNNYSMKELKAVKWKNFQRFTYLMFVLVILHSIFYRINANKETLIMYLYLPLFFGVLLFQIIGVVLKIRNKNRLVLE
ncbi:hypothetical protein U3A58_08620 [Algoriphagus sp. C2-6-M1]|uniref:hypothetical protein n=1 Tax=Algoriphagus persicinus TaxID=3108754 RepID=UPI002B383635|nr:hypothetical protein [Algoriphagus sp. C2-6-M1]MEB2780454.1 hypothetical protein [Algoriphagus sp. C2-6-M1]